VDVYPGITPDAMYFTPKPAAKSTGFKRFSFEVEIPDNLLHEVDATDLYGPRQVTEEI